VAARTDNPATEQEWRMWRIALGVLLAALGTNTHAEWVKVAESMEGKASHYVDPSTMRKMGTLMQVVTLTDYAEPQVISDTQRFLSVKMQDAFNCTERTGQHLSLTALAGNMGAGAVVATEPRPAPNRPIAPDTADEDIWKHVCARN
jgi:hypothetical protein